MANIIDKHLQNLSLPDIENGVLRLESDKAWKCIFCDERFDDGVIFRMGESLVFGERAARLHVAHSHGEVFTLLLDDAKWIGAVSEIQGAVMSAIHSGLSDTEIAVALGNKSESTVRNHRFHLKKEKRSAKLFLALMDLLERKDNMNESYIDFHGKITVSDDRTKVTPEEETKILKKYFDEASGLVLVRFPKKQKEKLVVLNRMCELFDRNRHYTEKEVNAIISAVYEEDHVTIRRYLIEYGFLDRKPDGSDYWLK